MKEVNEGLFLGEVALNGVRYEIYNDDNPDHLPYAVAVGTIDGYHFPNNSIEIPKTFMFDSAEDLCLVTKVGDYAFAHKGLLNIVLPRFMFVIGKCAFYDNDLRYLYLPDRVGYLGKAAFSSNKLIDVHFSKMLRSINRSAFSFNSLTKVDLSSVTEFIQKEAFAFNPIERIAWSNSSHLVVATGAFEGTVDKDCKNACPAYRSHTISRDAFSGGSNPLEMF